MSARTHRVVVLVADRASAFEAVAAATVFAGASSGHELYEVVVAGTDTAPRSTAAGFDLSPRAGLEAVAAADTLVVTPWPHQEHPGADVTDAVARAARRGARLVSVCSGSFVLAHAGVLDGRRATTHWWYADELARRFPTVEVVPDVLYVDEGDVLTSAGSAAGIDLCLHLVRRDHGAAVANDIARALVVPPQREGGQAQYVDHPRVPDPPGHGLDELCGWALEHLAEDLSVPVLAARVAMSPRTFARRFRAEVGTTPHRWVVAQRVDRARQLLETTELAVDHVASEVGFATADALRPPFKAATGLTPASYRRRFCCPGEPLAAAG